MDVTWPLVALAAVKVLRDELEYRRSRAVASELTETINGRSRFVRGEHVELIDRLTTGDERQRDHNTAPDLPQEHT